MLIFLQVLLTNNAQTEVETGTLEINIDQNTTVCNGVASVNIMATVTGASIYWKHDTHSPLMDQL
jgi:hypothetical protein